MSTKTQHIERRFRRHLETTARGLPEIEAKISEVRGVARDELRDRLHQVEVMEHAMERNFHELVDASGDPEVQRVRKLRKLCRYIEEEADTLRHESDFIAMGPTTTLDAVTSAVDNLIDSAKSILAEIRRGAVSGKKRN